MEQNNDNEDTKGQDPVLVVGRSGGICERCGANTEIRTLKTVDGKGRQCEVCTKCVRMSVICAKDALKQ